MKKKYLLVKFIGINMIRMHRFKLRHHRTQGVQDLDLTQGTQPVVPV
jgi:hypothetical protein